MSNKKYSELTEAQQERRRETNRKSQAHRSETQKERAKALMKQWKKDNPEKVRANNLRYHRNHPEAEYENAVRYHKNRPEKYREHGWRAHGIDMTHWSYKKYLEMLAVQKICPGCNTGLVATSKEAIGSFKLAIPDHDHSNGRVRGLLCNQCNIALGAVGDSKTTMRNLIAYLERSE